MIYQQEVLLSKILMNIVSKFLEFLNELQNYIFLTEKRKDLYDLL